jgi:uncharacterized membrane protein (UPF0127 family)
MELHSGQVIAENVAGAYNFYQRFRGLMFKKHFPAGSGLHIFPCPSIHTFWMKFPVDVLYLSRHMEVLEVDEELRPGKIGKKVKGTASVIELPAGSIQAAGLAPGDVLALEESPSRQIS